MMAARAAWSFFKLKKIEKRSKKKDGKKMHHHDIVFGLHFESNAQVPIPTSPHPHVYVATLNLARM